MMKKYVSLLLAALMMISAVLGAACATAEDSASGQFYNRSADPSTIDSWQALFQEDSTANVGTVWTDKTVTTTVPGGYNYTMSESNTNFMVTLSTLSSTMSITGHETLPTDTVFVLDLSSSMYRMSAGNYYSTDIVGKMVTAVNNAVHKLLTLNPLNRVGVVVYWGGGAIDPQSTNQHCTNLLELGNYEELEGNEYLIIDIGSASYNITSNNKTTHYDETNCALVGIHVNSNLKTRAGVSAVTQPYIMPGNRGNDNIAGTYMQLGIEAARKMFTAADTTIPADAEFQAGATRIPILVLMSDGEPTAASVNYQDVDQNTYANMGNNAIGERSPAETDFLTQLTAAYTRKLMDDHYVATTPLIYTLGLETNSVSFDVMDPKTTDEKYANSGAQSSSYQIKTGRSVSPKYTNSDDVVNARINYYWEKIITLPNNSSFLIDVLDATSSWQTSPEHWKVENVTIKKTNNFPSSLSHKYYVDKYFSAATADDLTNAFSSLVNEIILQSEYYPTYVEDGRIGMSGYVDFHDEIGEMLEVKKVHGLARQATNREIANINAITDQNERAKINLQDGIIYYKGEQIAQHFAANMTPNRQSEEDKAEITNVLTTLFQVRLGLDASQASQLLEALVERIDHQDALYYEDDNRYSNAFSWYADKDEKYLELVTKDKNGKEKAPTKNGAVYKITSYWYASPYDLENTNSFIRIKRNLTGLEKECVTWSVPASMIPLVRYAVKLSNDKLDNVTGVEYKNNYPMRAFFEVGLRSDVSKTHPHEAVKLLKQLKYGVDDGVLLNNGVYAFYSNKWKQQLADDGSVTVPTPDLDDLHNAQNTVVTFRPSEENNKYFITANSLLYKKDGNDYTNNPFTGDTPTPTSSNSYIKTYDFVKESDKWKLVWHNVDLPAGFDADENATQSGSKWYVKIHTPKAPDATLETLKTDNITNSVPNSVIESLDKKQEDGQDVTYSVSILGNNGVFYFTADTGIAITKKVVAGDDVTADSNQEFTFVIEPAEDSNITLNAASYALTYLDADGDVISGKASSVRPVDGKITVTLKAGQTAYLAGSSTTTNGCGLPAGSYTVTEQAANQEGECFFEVTDVTVNGTAETTPTRTVTVPVSQSEVTDVVYTNKPVKTGEILISKTVQGDSAPTDAEFTFEVQLDKELHAKKSFLVTYSNGTTHMLVADEDGKLTGITLQAGENAVISGIAAQQPVTVTVTETNIPAGFAAQQSSFKQVVTAGRTVEFAFTNTFTPATVAFSGTKTMEGRELLDTDKFTFELYQTDDSFSTDGVLPQTVYNSGGVITFDTVKLNSLGDHYFVIKEASGDLPSVTYDSSVYHVTVNVTAEDGALVAGTPTYTKVSPDNAETSAPSVTFVNKYDAADAGIQISGTKTLQLAQEGLTRTLKEGEFTFALYAADENFNITGKAIETVSNDANGNFAFQPITCDKPQMYYFVVREVIPEPPLPGVSYTQGEYRITVNVTDQPTSGQLNPKLVGQATWAPAISTFAMESLSVEINALTFENRYDAVAGHLTLGGTKTMIGRDLAENEFTFELYSATVDNDGNYIVTDEPPATATNGADGAFTFPELTYKTPGTYYYVVKEAVPTPVDSQLPSVTYDESIYHVRVVVTDNEEGQLVCTPTYTKVSGNTAEDVDKVTFTNKYEAVDSHLAITGTKVLEGIRPLTDGDFSFILYETQDDFATLIDTFTPVTVQNTVNPDGTSTFAFPAITYTETGTHYYVVKEVIQEGGSMLPGVTYDNHEHHITAVVGDNSPNGQLTVTATYTTVDPTQLILLDVNAPDELKTTLPLTGENKPTFTNTYDAADTFVDFSGTKKLTGRTLADGEFIFELFSTGSDFVVPADAQPFRTATNTGNAFTFPRIPYTDADVGDHYYVIREKDTLQPGVTYDTQTYQITVTVADDPTTAQLTTTITGIPEDGLTFSNEYDATDTSFAFSGTKTLIGRTLRAGEFSFSLYHASVDAQGSFVLGELISTVSNDAQGHFSFAALENINAAGDYHYIVKENDTGLPGVTYDPKVYCITVTVEDIGGVLKPTASVTTVPPASDAALLTLRPAPIPLTVEELDFTNTYDAADTFVDFSGTKKLTGRTLADGEFIFELFSTGSDFVVPADAQPLRTATNTGNAFAFPRIHYGDIDLGYHYYVIREKQTGRPGVICDTREYHIQVVVTDMAAVLHAAVSGIPQAGLAFSNHYIPNSVTVDFPGQKLLHGASLAEGMFSFHLYAADDQFQPVGAPLETVTNRLDGSFAFTPRVFGSAGVYHFLVMEDGSDPLPSITYDETVYHVTVRVTDDGLGQLTAATEIVSRDGKPISAPLFVNRYWRIPDTGDHSTLAPLLVLCLSSLAALIFISRRKART